MKSPIRPEQWLLYIALGVVAIFVLMRIPVFARYLLILAALALLGALIYGGIWWVRNRRRQKAEAAFRKTQRGMIQEKVEACARLMDRNESEMAEIRGNISELEDQLKLPDLSIHQRRESESLLQAFRSEYDLRQTKARFFGECRDKLNRLDQHLRLEQDLHLKKDKLRRLQENQYDDLAEVEALKSELELQTVYLDTIDELSHRMIASTTVDDAKHLQLELQEMTRELEKNG